MLHEKYIHNIHTSFSDSHATLMTSLLLLAVSRCLSQTGTPVDSIRLPCMLKSGTEDVLQWYQTSQCDKLGT